jgi:hypothetical protein
VTTCSLGKCARRNCSLLLLPVEKSLSNHSCNVGYKQCGFGRLSLFKYSKLYNVSDLFLFLTASRYHITDHSLETWTAGGTRRGDVATTLGTQRDQKGLPEDPQASQGRLPWQQRS